MGTRSGARDGVGWSQRYKAALREQLVPARRSNLKPATDLGREALTAGLDTLDLFKIHEQALVTLLPPHSSSGNSNGAIKRATSFFVRTLTPISNAHRSAHGSAHETNGHLTRLKVALRAQASELAATQRQLKREISRRQAAQESNKASKEHYGQLLEKSRLMQEHLRRVSHRILSAQEEERKRISRELHDEIGQILTAINLKLATLKQQASVNTTDLKKKIAVTQRLLERSMNTVHRFARELRPPVLDDLGLIPALHASMNAFTSRTHVLVRFTAFAAVEHLASDKRTVLYRVAQEALTNVAKHAQASQVKVTIQRAKGVVRMEISDNGKSFQVKRVLAARKVNRLGLVGMRERVEMVGGKFSVESAPDRGTTIRVEIPFNGEKERSRPTRVESME